MQLHKHHEQWMLEKLGGSCPPYERPDKHGLCQPDEVQPLTVSKHSERLLHISECNVGVRVKRVDTVIPFPMCEVCFLPQVTRYI